MALITGWGLNLDRDEIELALEDVAAVLRCSTRTVKRRLRAARTKLLSSKPEARS